jgi:hypothetical protein
MCYVFSFGTGIKPVRTIHILLCENTQHAVSFYFSKKKENDTRSNRCICANGFTFFSFEESFTCRWSHEECQLRTTVALWQFNSISPKMVPRKESPLKMFAPLLERFSNFGSIISKQALLIYLSEEYIVFACKVVEVTPGGNFVNKGSEYVHFASTPAGRGARPRALVDECRPR